jgi:hypothetical protein
MLPAHLADIRAAWSGTYMPLGERQTLVLRYGYGLTQAGIGRKLGVGDCPTKGVTGLA